MTEFNNNEVLLAKTWKVFTNKVNHKTKALGFCYHTLRPLFPGLGARNDSGGHEVEGEAGSGALRPIQPPPYRTSSCYFDRKF